MTTAVQQITAIIVDDEPLARRIILRYLGNDPEIKVIEQCGGGLPALDLVHQLQPDLLFLDVQMPGMNGFEMLQSLDTDKVPFIIFVTAYDEFAIQAFEVHALDYLLKPFDEERFKKALQHAKSRIRLLYQSQFMEQVSALLSEYRDKERRRTAVYPARLEIRSAGHISYVEVQDVDWIEAADNYVVFHTPSGSHLMRESMNRIQTQMDPGKFIRVHRCAIINLDRVRELKTTRFGARIVVLQNGREVRASRSQKLKLEESLKTK
ncbi:response regulator [bacterium]|nr:response regulator [bacterium]MCI0606404.1 response regulator [bacterium]